MTTTTMIPGRQADGSVGFYAYRRARGGYAQLWTRRKAGKTIEDTPTGMTYRTQAEAERETARLNGVQ